MDPDDNDPETAAYLARYGIRRAVYPEGPVEIDTTVLDYRIDGKQELLVAAWNDAPAAVRMTLLETTCKECGWNARGGRWCEHQRSIYRSRSA